MAKNYRDFDEEDGVWRTVGGRRIFIRTGQDLSSAMKESGKFKRTNSDVKKSELDKKAEKVVENMANNKETEEEKADSIRKEYDEWQQRIKENDSSKEDEKLLSSVKKEENERLEIAKDIAKEVYGLNEKNASPERIEKEARRILTPSDGEVLEKGEQPFTNSSGEIERSTESLKKWRDSLKESKEANKPAGQKMEDMIKESGVKTFADEIKGFKRVDENTLLPIRENETEEEVLEKYNERQKEYRKSLEPEVSKNLRDPKRTWNQDLVDTYIEMNERGMFEGKDKDIFTRKMKTMGGEPLYSPDRLKNTNVKEETNKQINDVIRQKTTNETMNEAIREKASEKASQVKVKGDSNVIPRDFEKGYGKFKVKTNANEKADDRFEITKDEYGNYHAKNLRTGETFATFKSHLSNNNVFEFENTNNNQITNSLRQKAYQKYLKEHPNSEMTFEEFKDMRKQ